MATVGRKLSLKKEDVFVSRLGTNLRLTITEVSPVAIEFVVERKIVDRKTGEVSIEERKRTVDRKDWPYVAAGYVRARKT